MLCVHFSLGCECFWILRKVNPFLKDNDIVSHEEYWISSTRVLRKLQSFPKLFLNKKSPSSQGVCFDKEWGREVC